MIKISRCGRIVRAGLPRLGGSQGSGGWANDPASRESGIGADEKRASWASSDGVRRSMRANRGRDTAPELALRRAVYALGLRYRVDTAPIPGSLRRADMVFRGPRVAAYLDGCFWHGCPVHFTVAKKNAKFWATKVATNRARDRDTDRRLLEAGWAVVRVWEHEDSAEAARRIAAVVGGRCY